MGNCYLAESITIAKDYVWEMMASLVLLEMRKCLAHNKRSFDEPMQGVLEKISMISTIWTTLKREADITPLTNINKSLDAKK